MLNVETDLKQKCKELFISVCEELAQKIPEKAPFFLALKREASDYKNFPIATNLSDVVADYYDVLDDATIEKFVKMRAL